MSSWSWEPNRFALVLNTEKLKISEALNTSYPSLSNLKSCISGTWVVFKRKERRGGILYCRKDSAQLSCPTKWRNLV